MVGGYDQKSIWQPGKWTHELLPAVHILVASFLFVFIPSDDVGEALDPRRLGPSLSRSLRLSPAGAPGLIGALCLGPGLRPWAPAAFFLSRPLKRAEGGGVFFQQLARGWFGLVWELLFLWDASKILVCAQESEGLHAVASSECHPDAGLC